MDKKINFNISDGMEFYAHEASINYTPLQFIFDFKTITPRIDPRSKEDTIINIRHNVVMANAYHAKKLHKLLGEVIKRYEKDFGKIKEPNVLKRLRKNRKDQANDKKIEKQSYFG